MYVPLDIQNLYIFLIWYIVLCCTDFIPTVSNKPPSSNNNNIGLILGIVLGVGVVSVLSN